MPGALDGDAAPAGSPLPDPPLPGSGGPWAGLGQAGDPLASAAGRRRGETGARGTAGLAEVRRLVENQFLTGFSHRLWVTGQVHAPEAGPDGSLHFELVAVDEDADWLRLPCDIAAESLPELRGLLHRVSDADLDDVVAPGRAARVGGLLRYDFPTHRLALAVSAVDPETTAQGLAEARAQALDDVRAAGLARHQQRLATPVAPVHVAVVGGSDDPVLHRAADRLRASGYAVRLRVVPAVLTGAGASGRLAEALAQVAGHSEVVLLVRGEGRELELAAFDGEDLARAVAATPVPVVAGLGGRGVRTVCDEVAAESLPTADAAVDSVLTRLAQAEDALRRWRGAVREEAEAALDRARADLVAAREAVEAAAAEAETRAAEAARRRWNMLLAGSGLAVAVIVLAVLVTGSPLGLLFLVPVVAALAMERWGSTGKDRRGSGMVLEETSFAEVLERLERIRDELRRSSSPEGVRSLHDEARQLVARGEQVLGRGLDEPLAVQGGSVLSGGQAVGPAAEPADEGAGSGGAGSAGAGSGGAASAGAASTVAAPASGDEPTSVVVPPGSGSDAAGAGRAAASPPDDAPRPTDGEDMPTQRQSVQGSGAAAGWADADTTQVIPTTRGR